MYEFIKGNVIELNPAYVVIEAGGIGYQINISLQSYSAIEGKEEMMLFLHQVVREDAHLLYGFAQKSERELFRMLISVSGVGANTARVILSSLSADELSTAILSSNIDALKRIKGIGLKTAQRIVVDLQGKVGRGGSELEIFSSLNNTTKQEALSALVMLGFAKGVAEKALEQILKQNPNHTVESLIKDALKGL
jgi:holliday junction DNA helicase RuvA